MKRLITAASLALLALPALAAEYGKPYEQLDVDRALPQIEIRADRALRDEPVRFAAAAGTTVTDASSDAVEPSAATQSPWANDWNFIAPAQ